MKKAQLLAFSQKPAFILSLILTVFFLKGLFLSDIIPMFAGQDEHRHYNTIQYLVEPKEKTWPMVHSALKNRTKNKLETFNLSVEIKNTVVAANLDSLDRGESYEKPIYPPGYWGTNEAQINARLWPPYNEINPPDVVRHEPLLYHRLASVIEKTFSSDSILVRFYLIRIFSVCLGTLTVLLTYFIAIYAGFRKKYSLLIAALVAFHPEFGIYLTNVNYDALLIPLFSLFTLGAILSLRYGPNWKNVGLMLAAIFLGLLTKPTAIILIPVFIALAAFYTGRSIQNKKRLALIIGVCLILAAVIIWLLSISYNLSSLLPGKNLGQDWISLQDYLATSLTIGHFTRASQDYWGGLLTWTGGSYSVSVSQIIWFFELFSLIGLIIYFFSKRHFPYLPEKKYVIFFIGMIIALQLGINYANWTIFSQSGALVQAAHGRYFFPNLTLHFILVFVGFGALFKKERYFNIALLAGLLLMFALSACLIFNIMIPATFL